MKIGIIVDSIRNNSTGVGFYAKDCITKLIRMAPNNEYIFLDYEVTDFNKKNLKLIKYPFRFFKNILWHEMLPFRIRNMDLDFVLNFSAHPHFLRYRQKELFFSYDISWYLYPKYHPILRVIMHKVSFKRSLKNCYKIVVDSINAKNNLIDYFKVPENKINIIYPSIFHDKETKLTIDRKINFQYILFIGTLEPRKNIISILNAFNKLKLSTNIKHKLILCGKKGWKWENIFKLIVKLNLSGDVLYFGYVSDADKEYLFKNAEMFVYPSFYEGFGIPVLEALSYKCPVITSNVSSLPEVIGNGGIQVNPNDIEQLMKSMKIIIENKKTRLTLIKEGLMQIKKLTNESQIKDLIKILSMN
jgi:glycosyltransferase involved in cell wall biosynthesis